MIFNLAVILSLQLAGEALARGLGLPAPGPVVGMALLLVAFMLRPGLAARMQETTRGILSHLSLLFVPAGVGVITHAEALGQTGPALLAAIVLSTALALAAGALSFVAVARLTAKTGARE
ncbi:MAG: hypothetical protein COW54_00170 [Rhodobacteraceae bacterium CG17_big_fil_post_rev_8_21_14_2_50_63_15]|nr:CidA/LrgA family protein [Roseovarius sp.]PIV80180.1 MAG: hypothetical protein COW54_00170 [Rhodobacteraceae bacterium CG17_big_fil_post_rev_8_21_14_2_50_63_15]